jgi:RHS repeat-associated protein
LYDAESNLFYFGARYYDPETGRFLTNDPVAGDALNPPSLHKYLYAYDSPMVYTDPWGEYALNDINERFDPNPNNIDDFMRLTSLVNQATNKGGGFESYRADYEAIRAGTGEFRTRDFKRDARVKMFDLYNKVFGSNEAQDNRGFIMTEGAPESLRAIDFREGIFTGVAEALNTPDWKKNVSAFAKDTAELGLTENIGQRLGVGATASGTALAAIFAPELIAAGGAYTLVPTTFAAAFYGTSQVMEASEKGWTQYSSDVGTATARPWLESKPYAAAIQFGSTAGMLASLAPAVQSVTRPIVQRAMRATEAKVLSVLRSIGQRREGIGRGVFFFGEDVLPYIDRPNATLGMSGNAHFFSPLEDVSSVASVSDAMRVSGQAPSITRAYTSGGEGYGVSFPIEGLETRLPTLSDARSNLNFLPGGRTAVRLGDKGGYLLNPTREYVTPGGLPMPQGSVLFRIGPNGEWIPTRRFK